MRKCLPKSSKIRQVDARSWKIETRIRKLETVSWEMDTVTQKIETCKRQLAQKCVKRARAGNPGTPVHSYRPDSPGSPREALFKYINIYIYIYIYDS